MTSTIVREFIQALQEEIDAIKKGNKGSVVKIFNGRFLRELSGSFVYVFNLENIPTVLEDSPAEIGIRGERYRAQVLMTQGLEVEIGIVHFCGSFIPEATLHTDLWYLLDILRKKYAECQSCLIKADFQLSEAVFSGRKLSVSPLPDTIECKKCGTKNRIKTNETVGVPICGKCGDHLNDRTPYSPSSSPPNESQRKAIEASFTSQLSVIWGPPGTGKTKTIANAVEAHLNAGRRVLLVSHANNAVDEALEDIANHLKSSSFYQEGKLIRLGKPQEEHYRKLEKDYEMVLPEKAAARICESMIREKESAEAERARIERSLARLNAIFQALQTVKVLSGEYDELRLSVSECNRRLANDGEYLKKSSEGLNRNKEKLIEAQSAGTLKRIFKRLDPRKIQHEIDQGQMAIDSAKRIIAETTNRLGELVNLRNTKEEQIERAKTEAESLLKQAGLSSDQLDKKKKELDSRKDVIVARIAEIDRQLGEVQKRILTDAKLVATTLTKTFVSKQFPDNPFDVLILDEASMAPLPHLYWAISRCRGFVTVVGDFLQLPPICIAKETMAQRWLGKSIFSILGINSVREAVSDARVSLLNTQYRMSPAISAIPNRLFYQGLLENHHSTFNHTVSDGVSVSPLVVVNTSRTNPWCSRLSSGGRFNLYNAVLSATLAKRMIETVSQGRIGIITPYKAQARLIGKIAKDWGILDRVRVSTVHLFQGGEESIIIFDSAEGAGTRVAPMLDDTIPDSDAELLLNVAITRAKSRFYFVGHIDHLLYDLHPKASLAQLIQYLNENGDIRDSKQFVDDYFTNDFDAWADELLATTASASVHLSGHAYTGKDFWPQFISDLKTARERFIIHSPFLTISRSGKFMDYFRSMIGRGVTITIHTWPSSRQQGNMVEQSETVIKNLRSIGVKVIEGYHSYKKHFKTAIIDNHILWDGSLNILSHKDTEEHMWRYEGAAAVGQIIKDLELDDHNAVGTQTQSACPGSQRLPNCDGYFVIRVSRMGGRKFQSCSNFPRCDHTEPLEQPSQTGKTKSPARRSSRIR